MRVNVKNALIVGCLGALLTGPALALEEKKEKRKDESASEPAKAAIETETKPESKSWLGDFGLTFIYENSVGSGSFTTKGESAQPYWNMSYSIRPSYTISKDLRIKTSLRFDLDQNIIENYQSSNVEPNQLQFYDIRWSFSQGGFAGFGAEGFGPVDDEGKRGDFLSFDWSATFYFPTAKASQLSNKILGLGAAFYTTFQPVNWFDFKYTFGAVKNFNEYTGKVLDTSNLSLPAQSRANGAESLGEGLVALAGYNLEWSMTQDLALDFMWPAGLGDMSLTIGWTYFQNYTYGNTARDEFTAENATPGRGYSDLMRGVVDISWQPISYLGVSIGWLVDQSPKTADGSDFRFPWWDTSNGSENRQSFYLDLVGTF